MKERLVHNRYALAVLEAAPEKDLDRIADQFLEFANVLATNEEVRAVLADLTLDLDIQYEALRALGQKAQLDPILLRLLDLVVHNRKTPYLLGMAREFRRLVDVHFGRIEVAVRIGRDIPADQEERLRKKLAEVTGKQVRLKKNIDSKMLGGIAVTIGNLVIDKTMRGTLAAIRRRLLEEKN